MDGKEYISGVLDDYGRRVALEVLKDLSKHMYPSYDLFGKKTLVINRDKFEAVRAKHLDRKMSKEEKVWL